MDARIIGVHPIEYSEEWFVEHVFRPGREDGAWEEPDDEKALAEAFEDEGEDYEENMEGLHVIEMEIDSGGEPVDLGKVTQDAGQSSSSQVPYDEKYLVGGAWVERASDWRGRTRVAFYLHFVEFDRPLHGPWGSLALPEPTPLPERLSVFRSYQRP